MIFEHPINQRETHIRPPIRFHYITPNPLPRQYSLANYPSVHVSNIPIRTHVHPLPQILQRNSSPERWNKPQRKKIFDRTYSTKSTFFGRSDDGFLREKTRSTGKLHPSTKKQRKAIFSRDKRENKVLVRQEQPFLQTAPLQYSSNLSSNLKLKPPSSLTSYINVDALRREPRQHYQINVFGREHEDFFPMDRPVPDITSEVKVSLSDDESYASLSINCSPLPLQTQERFFDKDLSHDAPKKQQKLAEVNLYQTTIHGNFLRRVTPPTPALLQTLKRLMDSQVKQHLLPYLLIVMGLFLLLVQVSK